MKKPVTKTVYIVGAGFSSHAGLPLTSSFTSAILEARSYDQGPSRLIVEHLTRFIKEAFDHSKNAGAKLWPDLEDIFTCVDLSANSGHHLGGHFSPADLRTVRRAILSRTVRMLDQKYKAGQKRKQSPQWAALDRFFSMADPSTDGFISMNWDTVIERKMESAQDMVALDYGCEAIAAGIPDLPNPEYFPSQAKYEAAMRKPLVVKPFVSGTTKAAPPTIPAIKIHGSINWLYCDNCRRLFSFDPAKAVRIANQLMTEDDLRRIGKSIGKNGAAAQITLARMVATPRLTCICTEGVPLGTRIATFSYRKALEFPMFQKSWFAAESLLRDAARWIFIGYSLPSADFEFKYLLKRMQLCRRTQPEIIVISGGDPEMLARTQANYRRFFGNTISKSNFVEDGLLTFTP